MTIPEDMQVIKAHGTDSYAAFIINGHGDTFHVEYGRPGIIDDLFQPLPEVYPMSEKEAFMKNFSRIPSPDEALFSNSPKEDMQQNIFDSNYYRYDTINNIVVKIVQPKQSGKGMTGLFVPLLKDSMSFSLYATGLDEKENLEALELFRTLRYK